MEELTRIDKTWIPSLLLLVLTAAAGAAEKPSWTGTWVPDPASSSQSKELKKAPDPNAPPASPAPSVAIQEHLHTMRVVHAEPHLTLEYLESDGTVISMTNLTTGGKENLNPRAGGALTHRSTSTWDGNVLKMAWSLEQGSKVVIAGVDRRELT